MLEGALCAGPPSIAHADGQRSSSSPSASRMLLRTSSDMKNSAAYAEEEEEASGRCRWLVRGQLEGNCQNHILLPPIHSVRCPQGKDYPVASSLHHCLRLGCYALVPGMMI